MTVSILAGHKKRKVTTVGDAVDCAEEIRLKIEQVKAICTLVGFAPKHWDEMADETVPNAMWAAEALLRDADACAEKLSHMARDLGATRGASAGTQQ